MSNENLKYLVFAIESSCDETSLSLLAVPDFKQNQNDLEYLRKVKIISSIISSQIKIHEQYGGVVPEIGARKHAEQIHFIWTEMLQKADMSIIDLLYSSRFPTIDPETDVQTKVLLLIDKIMVTTNPGLVSALRVGHEFAKTIQFFAIQERVKYEIELKPEIVEINHLRGHMASSYYLL